ncbi:MAG TPA: heparan-alpha-glucosaminide N-acetyltransferase domain-containing protein, partial [Candidatus Angelobacter sp.]|nr:heparan-alpha-glucosaminide N-acetyltransferase domain-containing protein [Candidatus Angelobacter sp.]
METVPATDNSHNQGFPRARLDSVDTLRGLVMVIMALDHTRDFFSKDLAFDPTDLTKTHSALFLTRWITHYCAPVFIFLAGTGAFLSTTRGKTQKELSWFLLTRGLWLVLLELTWVRCFGWLFNFDYHFAMGIVIWAIGWSMVALAALVFLPLRWVASVGLVMIVGHNLLDPVEPESLGAFGWLWKVLHSGGIIVPVD